MLNAPDTTFYNLPFKLDYQYIKTIDEAFKSFSYFDRFNAVAVDTETTGLDPHSCNVILLQLALPNGKVFVYDLRYIPGELFKVILEDKRFLHILQNAVFDYKMLKANYKISINRIYDTMLAEKCINLGILNAPANLKHLVYKYLNYVIEKDVGAEFCDPQLGELTNRQIQYSAHDAACLFNIVKAQNPVIADQKLNRVCKLEFEFAPCMADMELTGVLLDKNKWKIITKDAEKKITDLTKEILPCLSAGVKQQGLFGVPAINLASNQRLLDCLNNLGLHMEDTSVESLHMREKAHPVIPMLLEYRQLEKLLSSFGNSILKKIHPNTGRLHPSYTQMIRTGRLSCSNPNLQQIPGQTAFRSCFIAKPGYKIVTSDMSQAELRILACFSKDPVFVNAYKAGKDLHTATACGVYGITEEEVIADKNLPDGDPAKKDYRKNVKSINFGLCFPHDTNILTDEGFKTIDNCDIDDWVAHDIGSDRIIDTMYMGEKEVFEIVTKYGYSIQATAEHVIKVINSDGNYVSKALNKVDVNNDMVCIKVGTNLFPPRKYVFDDFDTSKYSNCKSFVLPKVLDEDTASFLGLFVAEGSLMKTSPFKKLKGVTFGFSTKDEERLDAIYKLISRVFGPRFSVYTYENRPAIDYRITSFVFAEWVNSLFNLSEDKTRTIHIPDCIKQSPKKIQACFLRWLFEGDGTVKQNNKGFTVSYTTVSKRLIRDLQLVLLNFGIVSTVHGYRPKKYPYRKYYVLNVISKKSNEQFINEIGFVLQRKNDKYTNTSDVELSHYFIGNQLNTLKELERQRNRDIVYNSAKKDVLDKAIKRGGSIGNKHLKLFTEYNELFKFLYDNNIMTLPISAIKGKGIKKVYDISVENRELFLANGFVVHNCYGMSKYGLSTRLGIEVDEAEQMIDDYFKSYRGVKRYLDKSAEMAINKGYSTTISGRRRYYTLPNADMENDERKKILDAIRRRGKNTGIQGCFVYNTNVFGAGFIGDNVGKQRILSSGKEESIKAIGKYSGKQEVYKLTTDMGFTLTGTFDHPIVVKNGKYDTMCALGETKNKSVRMYTGKYEGFPISIEDSISRFKVITKNNYITKELGFILGCLYDSGYFESRQKLFYIKNNKITKRLVDTCIKYFKTWGNPAKSCPIKLVNKGQKVFINFNDSVKKLLYCLLYDNAGRISYIPHILNSPAEIRESFVSGFLGCRSRITDNGEKQTLSILCSNNIVAFTLQQLLLSVGVVAFKEVGESGDSQLTILDDFITNAGSLIDDYRLGLNLYSTLPELEFYDGVSSIERVGLRDTYDFVSGDEPHMYIANGFKVSNSNADILKQSIINLSNNIKEKEYDADIVINVHDEIAVEVREDQAEDLSKTLTGSIIDAWDSFFTEIPMVADANIGDYWDH